MPYTHEVCSCVRLKCLRFFPGCPKSMQDAWRKWRKACLFPPKTNTDNNRKTQLRILRQFREVDARADCRDALADHRFARVFLPPGRAELQASPARLRYHERRTPRAAHVRMGRSEDAHVRMGRSARRTHLCVLRCACFGKTSLVGVCVRGGLIGPPPSTTRI